MATSATTADALIHARGLTKRFTNLVADDAIDFDVERGEAFGFLGPNGAGKTSTMRMIGCVSTASGGTLRVLGQDPARDGSRIRAPLGVGPQPDTLDSELLVDENLFTYARYFGIARDEARRRSEQLLDFVQLRDRARDRVEVLSGGVKRRLTIARALVNEPELLLLDEPTTVLDTQARHLVWDRLYRLKQQGVTIVLTTHYMDEAEQLCDRLVVMDKAKIVAFGSPQSLIDQYSSREVLELRFPIDTTPALDKLDGLARPLALGAARAPGRHADRILLRRGGHRGVDLRPYLAGLRPCPDCADSLVPLLGNVLSNHRLPRCTAAGGAADAPVPRCRLAAQPGDRHARPLDPARHRLPGHPWCGCPRPRRTPARAPAAQVAGSIGAASARAPATSLGDAPREHPDP